jgi:hypothetical protein
MNIEAQQKLQRLFDAGYKISVSTRYVDSLVHDISEDEHGQICYSSEVYTARALRGVHEFEVEVFKPVENWQGVKLED